MNILDTIIEYKKSEVQNNKKLCSLDDLKQKCYSLSPPKSFLEILLNFKLKNKTALIAEVKKASPSKGIIREDFNPLEIAKIYQKTGAAAISVLTDEKFFQGSAEYLKEIKKNIDIPILRKDFIIDEYQIYETREMGADIILLIASALSKSKLKEFYSISKELGLTVLLEVHDKKEFDFALKINAEIIGINNRDLQTFEVCLDNTIELIKDKKFNNSFIISESGIHNNDDVKLLKSFGVDGILVGESLIKSSDIEKAVISLLE